MKKAIVVLGMHRSGTSSIAGTLAALGVASPKTLMPEHPTDNPKGYWESLPIVRLNDRVLKAAGSAWNDWHPMPAAWADTPEAHQLFTALTETLATEFGDASVIVLKDPRICRLFPLWKRALRMAGYDPLILIPLRHPQEVAASLASRDGMSEGEGQMLWLRHLLEAERETRAEKRVFMVWDDFIKDWRASVEHISRSLNLPLLPADAERIAAADALVDPRLRRNTVKARSDGEHEPSVQAYMALRSLCQSPYSKFQMAILDQISQDLALAHLYMGNLTSDLRQRLVRLESERNSYLNLKNRLEEERARVERRNAEIKALTARIKQSRERQGPLLKEKDALISSLSSRILERDQGNEGLATRLASAKDRIAELEQANNHLNMKLRTQQTHKRDKGD